MNIHKSQLLYYSPGDSMGGAHTALGNGQDHQTLSSQRLKKGQTKLPSYWAWPIYTWFTCWKWWFSITISVYQRVIFKMWLIFPEFRGMDDHTGHQKANPRKPTARQLPRTGIPCNIPWHDMYIWYGLIWVLARSLQKTRFLESFAIASCCVGLPEMCSPTNRTTGFSNLSNDSNWDFQLPTY